MNKEGLDAVTLRVLKIINVLAGNKQTGLKINVLDKRGLKIYVIDVSTWWANRFRGWRSKR